MEIMIGLEVDKVTEKYVQFSGKGVYLNISLRMMTGILRPWRMMTEWKKFAHHYLIDQISLLTLHIDFNVCLCWNIKQRH